jgi:uncharacterized membrane protein
VSPSSRSEAQQRADAIRVFQTELERLEREGVLALGEDQRRAIAQHHTGLLGQYAQAFDIDRDVQAKQLSLGMRIASFLGALALAASVFFLFYQFWGLFPTMAQVAILLVAALGTLAGTVWIQGRDATGYFTKLAAMVAFACFVLNIFMIGQIFNITPSDKALLPWAVFALLLAFVFALLTLFSPMLVLANWGQVSYLDLKPNLVEGFYQVLGFAGSAAAVWIGVRRHWPEVVNTGVTFFVIFLYTKFFDWWWDTMPKYLLFLVLGLTALLFLVVLKRLRGVGKKPPGGSA